MRESYWNELVSKGSRNEIFSELQIVYVLNLPLFKSREDHALLGKLLEASEPGRGRKIVA